MTVRDSPQHSQCSNRSRTSSWLHHCRRAGWMREGGTGRRGLLAWGCGEHIFLFILIENVVVVSVKLHKHLSEEIPTRLRHLYYLHVSYQRPSSLSSPSPLPAPTGPPHHLACTMLLCAAWWKWRPQQRMLSLDVYKRLYSAGFEMWRRHTPLCSCLCK
jgi:hypothetical protein